MPPFTDRLAQLQKLTPNHLHQKSLALRIELGAIEWNLALCLLAASRSRSFQKLGYSNVTEYAERALRISGRKTGELLGLAHALEHLPKLSEAFRYGKLCWAKARAIHGVASPETEQQWVDYAVSHHSDEVLRMVALCPNAWKRHNALDASIAGNPIASPDALAEVLATTVATTESRVVADDHRGQHQESVTLGATGVPQSGEAQKAPLGTSSKETSFPNSALPTAQSAGNNFGSSAGFSAPSAENNFASSVGGNSATTESAPPARGPKMIRVVLEFTADQFALYERAAARVRAKTRGRLSQATIVSQMAEAYLDSGNSRSRAKHMVVIHAQPSTGQTWYETSQGPLPVARDVLLAALKTGPTPVVLEGGGVPFPSDGRLPNLSFQSSDGTSDNEPCPGRRGPTSEPGLFRDEPNGSEQPGSKMQPKADPSRGASCDMQQDSRGPIVDVSKIEQDGAGPSGHANKFQQDVHPSRETIESDRSRYVPADVMRALKARDGHSCSRCRRRQVSLQVHHKKPVSKGGGNNLRDLCLLCEPCHQFVHQPDYQTNPTWRKAKANAIARGTTSSHTG